MSPLTLMTFGASNQEESTPYVLATSSQSPEPSGLFFPLEPESHGSYLLAPAHLLCPFYPSLHIPETLSLGVN